MLLDQFDFYFYYQVHKNKHVNAKEVLGNKHRADDYDTRTELDTEVM